MPVFEYKCSGCGREFEVLQKSQRQKVSCPECKSSKVVKKLSVFNAAVKEGQSKKCLGCSDLSCPHSNN